MFFGLLLIGKPLIMKRSASLVIMDFQWFWYVTIKQKWAKSGNVLFVGKLNQSFLGRYFRIRSFRFRKC